MSKLKVLHYINQFYAGIGGEEKADHEPELRVGPVGPGAAFTAAYADKAEIVNTIVCGDSFFNENLEEAKKRILAMVKQVNPDLFVAGPAFNAGRYGVACGAVCQMVKEETGIPVVTGMYIENPGAEMYKDKVYIISTKPSATGMRTAVPQMAALSLKLANNEPILSSAEEGYMPNGVRVNFFEKERGAKRAVNMLLAKMAGKPYTTEYPMPAFDRVPPAPAIKDLTKATVALVTSGGIVPKGNPDHIEASSASKYGEYDITGIDDLTGDGYETAHGGYDPTCANDDADRVLPVDILRDLEKEGIIGKLHNLFYTTVGNGTAVKSAKAFAAEIAAKLKKDGVDVVILTSTWGTCTRCGATMVKEIERAGIPVVHICTVTPISMTVGANRIVPAVAIPYPLGNPALNKGEEKQLRRKIVLTALDALSTEVEDQTIFEVK